jgi:hypothetical protein
MDAWSNGRWRSLAALAGLLAILGGIDVWWLLRFRQGFPLDIDESGYLQFAFFLHDSLRTHGLHGFWSAFQHQGGLPPLFPGTTAVLGFIWGANRTIPSMGVQLVFVGVLIGSTFGATRRLVRSDAAGVVAAVAVATIPAVTDFTRTYHMVIPSTAMLSLAMYLLLGSGRLRSRPWSIAFGIAIGLTLLSRTMMLAFIPSLLLAACWLAVADRALRRRLPNLGLAVAAALTTSLVWYATSWRPIADYLTSAGYGSTSARYGPGSSVLTAHYWTREAVGAVNSSLYLPLAAVIVSAFVVAIWRSVPGQGAIGESLARAARSEAIVPALVVVEGYLALTSTRNEGTGFVVPILPPLVILAVTASFKAPPRVRRTLVAGLVAVSVFDVVMKADVVPSISRPTATYIPLLGRLQVTNGEGYLQQNLAANAGYSLGPPTHWLADRDKGWQVMYTTIAVYLHSLGPPDPSCRLAPNEPLLNASALRLSTYRLYHEGGNLGYVDTGAGDTVAAYRSFLVRDRPQVVITVDPSGPQYGPRITPATLEAALRSAGFDERRRLRTPDARVLAFWAS